MHVDHVVPGLRPSHLPALECRVEEWEAMSPRTAREKQAAKEGFYGGIGVALQVLFYGEGGTSTFYNEIVGACGSDELIAQARRDGNYASSGLKTWAREQRQRERTQAWMKARAFARKGKG